MQVTGALRYLIRRRAHPAHLALARQNRQRVGGKLPAVPGARRCQRLPEPNPLAPQHL
jgi:hypothetical protein